MQWFTYKRCQKTVSSAYNEPAYKHKKRRIHVPLKKRLASSISSRHSELMLGITRKNVLRKGFVFGAFCCMEH